MLERLREAAERRLGYTVKPTQYVEGLEEQSASWGTFADEVEDYIDMTVDWAGGRFQTMNPERRRYLTRQARIAFVKDPLAGAEANLRANFAIGRGVPTPSAADEDVQRIIDEAWDDPNNQRKLCSYEAQRHRSNDLLAGANLFPVAFEANGRVRIGFHDEDLVTDIVTDPEDEETPLWYVVRKHETKWDFGAHHAEFVGPNIKNGTERVWYVEHWRNVEDVDNWAQQTGGTKPPRPGNADILPGKMEHFRVNRIGRSQFGMPPWARTMRFMTAMNQLTEAQVQMRQAAATLVAKRTRASGPRDIVRTASNLLKQSGQLAASRFGGQFYGDSPSTAGPGTNPDRGLTPPPAGSWWLENDADRLEAVRLSSGSSEAAQDAQIVRAPIAAASGFGQHYLGDASSTNLATASTLELPTLMDVLAWQESLEGILRWFTDYAIECAVKSGRLGGTISEGADDGRPLPLLHVQEDKAELERRTGKDLSYTFEMPYPGRRNLPDVVNAATTMATVFDPMGMNMDMRRMLLEYALRHGFELENPAELTDKVLPEQQGSGFGPDGAAAAGGAAMAAQLAQILGGRGPASGQGGGVPGQPPQQNTRQPKEQSAQSQYGERRQATPPGEQMAAGLQEVTEDALRSLLRGDVDAAFAELLGTPAALVPGEDRRNGHP